MITFLRPTRRRVAAALAATTLASTALTLSAGVADAAATPRYVVTVKQLKAIDETGPDWAGSDEIYAGFEVTETGTGKHLGGLRTQLFKGFDAGETKTADSDKNCVPASEFFALKSGHSFMDGRFGDRWGCHYSTGVTAPFTVTGAAFEKETCYDGDCVWDSQSRNPLHAYGVWDNSIDGGRLLFSPQGLAADLPAVKSQRDYTIEHIEDYHPALEAHYRSTITVKRVS